MQRALIVPLVLAALVSAVVGFGALGMERGMAPMVSVRPDTSVVFGSNRYQSSNSTSWTMFDEEFEISNFDSTKRYEFRIRNGDADGSHRLTQVSLVLNGRELMNASDVTGTVSFAVKVAWPLASNELIVSVRGPSGHHMDLDLISTPDPAYPVEGPTQYTKNSPGGYAYFEVNFSKPTSALSPHTLVLTNGAPDGSHRVTSAQVYLNDTEVIGVGECGSGTARLERLVSLSADNDYVVVLQGGAGSYVHVSFTATDSTPPVVSLTAPADSFATAADSVVVAGRVTDEISGTVQVNSLAAHATPDSFTDAVTLASDGHHAITVHAVNAAGYGTDAVRTVTRDRQAPTLSVSLAQLDTLDTPFAVLTDTLTWSDLTKTVITIDGDSVAASTSGRIGYSYPLAFGPNRIVFRATDAAGNADTVTRFVFRRDPEEPDPISSGEATQQAGTLSPTATTSFYEGVKFLYMGGNGGNPLQQGMLPESATVKPNLAAAIRGTVRSRDLGPLPNVTVQVLGHPEYGHTTSRADGQFDLIVNGGAQMTLRFTKDHYLEAQRQVTPVVNDFNLLDDVALIGKTARVTRVGLASWGFARGRFASDGNGDRDLRLLFAPQTTATVVADGADPVTLTDSVHVRATEYTVGGDGPRAMPAQLPPSTAYTYCVNLALDEADAIGEAAGDPAPKVQFSNPVVGYVQNFLDLPVGIQVPVGYYDSKVGQWKSSEDAIVLKILDFKGDTAVIASQADTADSPARLEALGITAEERIQLKSEFVKGATLWRMALRHFSPVDANLNMLAVAAAGSNASGRAQQPQGLVDHSCEGTGSIIECENRVLGERIPIVGTPFSLNYRSYHAPGDQAIRTVRIPVIGSTVPEGLLRILVQLDVAGKRYKQVIDDPSAGMDPVVFTWDGLDAYGRRVQGSVNALIQVGYQYSVSYSGGGGSRSFGRPSPGGGSAGLATKDRNVGRTTWSRRTISLGAPGTGSDGLGGWTISPHHFFDLTGQGAVYFGDGSVLLGSRLQPTVTTYAQLASGALSPIIALAPDQTLYIANSNNGTIARMPRGGALQVIAGTGTAGLYSNDNDNATQTTMRSFSDLLVAPDGCLYVSMYDDQPNSPINNRVCRLTKHTADSAWSVRSIIAGKGGNDWYFGGGDGDSVKSAWVCQPRAITLGPDGSLFIADRQVYRNNIRRIGPDSLITRYAGNEARGSSTETGEATALPLGDFDPGVLLSDESGNVYVIEGSDWQLRRIAPDGIVSPHVHRGDVELLMGGFNAAASLTCGAFAPDGSMYLGMWAGENWPGFRCVIRRDPDSTLAVIAGRGGGAFVEGAIAQGAALGSPYGLEAAPDGSYFVVSGLKIMRVAKTLATASAGELRVASEDGAEVYSFDLRGRHLRTIDAFTGATRYSFDYDLAGQLTVIHDANGDRTEIHRTGGQAYEIENPYGLRTGLGFQNGLLHTITNPANETTTLGYEQPGGPGLLTSLEDAEHHTHVFDYAGDGRLWHDTEPTLPASTQELEVTYAALSRTVERTTGESRLIRYTVTDLYDGTQQRSIVGTDNHLTFMSDSTDGKVRLWEPEGMTTTASIGPDPRFGLLAPIPSRITEVLPSGRSRVTEVAREASGYGPPASWRQDVKANGQLFRTDYDPATRRFTTTSPEGRQFTTSIDTAGRVTQVAVGGLSTVDLTYDSRGRLWTVAEGGRLWTYAYDDSGRVRTVIGPRGDTTAIHYDPAGRVLREDLPGGRRIGFGYDHNGNVTTVTPPAGLDHGFEYTPIDLLSTYTPPIVDGVPFPATSYSYNRDRQLTSADYPGGAGLSLGYEPGTGRLSSLDQPRGATTIAYKATTGLADSVHASPDTIGLRYDYDGLFITKEEWTGRVAGRVDRTFDSFFRDSIESVNGLLPAVFAYDNDGLLTGITVNGMTETITHRAGDGLDSTTSVGNVTSHCSYNNHGELWKLTYTWPDTGSFEQTLERDSLGRITRVTEGGISSHVFDYHYDAAGRLDSVAVDGVKQAGYTYDANGNRVAWRGPTAADTATAHYDQQDRLLRYKNTAYTYTPIGDLASCVDSVGNESRFTYDLLGNMVGAHVAGDSLTYLVDGLNRRVGRVANGRPTHCWLYRNGLNVIAELDSSGVLINRYVYGTREHVPDLVIRGGATYRLVTDYLGSVRAVVNVADGTVAERLDYGPWGSIGLDTNPGFLTLGFAGGLTDTTTALVRFGARDYDPSVGRWTCQDPAGFWGGDVSLHAYVGNAPTCAIDPAGLGTSATHRGTVVNLSNQCILVSGNNPSGPGQLQYWIRPHVMRPETPFESNDIDAVFVNGKVVKIRGILWSLIAFDINKDGSLKSFYWPLATMWPNQVFSVDEWREMNGGLVPPAKTPEECHCQRGAGQ